MDFLNRFKEEFGEIEYEEILEEIESFGYKQLSDNTEILNIEKETKQIEQKELTNLEIAKILKKQLPKYIYGQDHVIERIVDYFKNSLIPKKGPKATFLFMGPPAVGKTYLAEIMTKLFNGYKFKVFDMAQFTRHDDGMILYGSDFKFSNSKPGFLTDFVLKNPKSIIVFDEIEKANNTIQNALLSIFNNGKMNDKCGWIVIDGEYVPFDGDKSKRNENYPAYPDVTEVDFSETILIFTSNVGKELYNSKFFWEIVKDDYNRAEHMIIEALQKETKLSENNQPVPAITPPFLSRLTSGEILLFKKLDFNSLLKIVKDVFDEYKKLVAKNYKIKIAGLNKFIYSILLLSYAPRIDIRRLKSKVGAEFFDLVSDYIVENDLDIETKRKVAVEVDKKVKEFFNEEIKPLLKEDIVRYMFRKNLTLKIEKKLEYKDNVFIYKITDVYFEKVANISDIGEDGILFDVPDVSFDDIAGHDKVKRRLREIVKLLKNPKALAKLGVDLPKGMLLYGPPGTGKTMLAKALANEANLPFLATTGTDLLNANKLERIFETAKEYAPSIIFVDEFDSVGRRDTNDGTEFIINKLLAKLNGFRDDEDIFVIAATNFPERIDPAILRSGRIDLLFEVKALDKKARRYFIEKTINHYKTKGKFDIDKLVIYTTGMNGADLEKVKREAGLEMIRSSREFLDEPLLIEMINTIKYGEKIEDIDISKTLEATAIHEAGHAVITKILRPELKIEQITITPRNKALGFVAYNDEDNYKNLSKEDIKKQLQILLAGRFAQIKKYGTEGIDSGARNDLEKATRLAYMAIAELGMDEELGNVNLESLIEHKLNIDDKIRDRVLAWLKEAEKSVAKLIDKNFDKIKKVAARLLEEETIDEEEFVFILKYKS
jgi:ATP-dependent metalloprotease FtsH